MNDVDEAKELAHLMVLDIERNKKSLHLLCLQSSRLALLLNNQEKSKYFSVMAKKGSEIESFLNTYGPLIKKLSEKIDPREIYTYEEESSSMSLRISKSIELIDAEKELRKMKNRGSEFREPQEDIKRYKNYKEKSSNIQTEIYEYAMNTHYQLKFTENNIDILNEYRNIVDNKLPDILPNSKDKLNSISTNLHSNNKEDWSNAVHMCRKLLQDLADVLYPSSNDLVEKNGKKIDVSKGKYINRLINYIDDNSKSEKFKQITGSDIKYIGERLDSIYESANKGSHETIETLEEAKRYVIHTYLFIGDVLSLVETHD